MLLLKTLVCFFLTPVFGMGIFFLIAAFPDLCLLVPFLYENMPMQYTEILKVVKNENFQQKNFGIFLIFAQNIDSGHMLEPPRRDGSNEYPQSMFWTKNKTKISIPLHIPVLLI